jgi:hypothetical protein
MAAFLTVDILRAPAAPSGRLACRWQTVVSAPFFPPPH